MKHLNSSLSMESINDIIDTQSFNRQLVDETSDLIGGGGGGVGNATASFLKRSPTPSNMAGLPVHEVIGDEHDVGHNLVTTGDDESDVSGAVVMVIDEIGQSPVQTTYQVMPQHHLHLHNGHLNLHQQQHTHVDRLCATASPVDFVGTDVTLGDSLSVSSSNSAMPQIIAVKQEHKLVIINHSSGNSKHSSSGHAGHLSNKRGNHALDIRSVGVIDELSSDAVEVTLNQHHQQLLQQQQQQQQQQHYGHHRHLQTIDMHQHHHPHHHHHQHQQHQQQQQQQQHRHQQQSPQQRHQFVQHNNNNNNNGSHSNQPHSDALSVIVQPHEDDNAVDDDDEDSADSTGQLLSPALGGVGVVGDNSLEHTTYQTLTSVNERMSPPGFSPTSYATLTPIQPLPPISTMSDKFAYGGHIGGGGGAAGAGSVPGSSAGGGSSDCGPFAGMPHHQNSLSGLSLSGLSGVQSPYSSYDKLSSMMSPTSHNYASSPSHTLSGMVVSCDLHGTAVPSPGGCGALSPQSDLHSPPLSGLSSGGKAGMLHAANSVQKQVVCLSPSRVAADGGIVITSGGGVIYESAYGGHQSHEHDLMVTTTTSSSNSTGGRNSQMRLQHSPTLSPHSISAGSMHSHSPGSCSLSANHATSVIALPQMNSALAVPSVSLVGSDLVDLPRLNHDAVVASLTPTPPPIALTDVGSNNSERGHLALSARNQQQQQEAQLHGKNHNANPPITSDCNPNSGLHLHNMCNMNQQHDSAASQQQQQHQSQNQHQNEHEQLQKLHMISSSASASTAASASGRVSNSSTGTGTATGSSGLGGSDMEEINTKELAQRISAELKRYSIPQAIFAQRVLCRSQGTLSDLLRNPKPWSKLKSGRETFRRMFKWLQEPEFQRMSALRMAAAQIPQRSGGLAAGGGSNGGGGNAIGGGGGGGSSNGGSLGGHNSTGLTASHSSAPTTTCRRKEEPHMEHMSQPKKPRLVFTDLQRRTLQAIFKETKRPSKEMQVTIARQLGLEPTTVGNFFMNARRRSMDKWRDDDGKNSQHHHHGSNSSTAGGHGGGNGNHHHASMSPLENQHSLDFDDEHDDMELELEHNDFDLIDGGHDDDDDDDDNDDML